MPKKKYYPWHKEPCHNCGTEFLLTRGNPMEIDIKEEILCEGCEMYMRGYREGLERADSKLRPPLHSFACIMEEQLKNNDYKGKEGWRDVNAQELFSKLLEEVRELHIAICTGKDVPREAADTANMAMMIADVRRER